MDARPFRLVIFSRRLRPGLTKTRLTPAFTGEEACEIQAAFLEDTVERACQAVGNQAQVRLAWSDTPQPESEGQLEIPPTVLQETQPAGDLGERMALTIQEGLRAGSPTAILGSDSPTLPPDHIASGLRALERSEVVLGPARDGGYYLIGMSKLHLEVFQNISWGTPEVLQVTRKRLKAAGAQVEELGSWHDVDTPDDVARLWRELLRMQQRHPGEVPPRTFAVLSRLVPGKEGLHGES